jgi:putative tryptophan/tyrosine transport system substrate-binding protein
MNRRDVITLIGGAVAAASMSWPHAARAQQGGKVFRIGFLGLPGATSLPERTEAFRSGLRDLGYQEGRDVVIEYRWADGDYDRIPALLAELIASKVDVIVTHGSPGAMAARDAATSIPIVVAVVGDAIGMGLVSNLARPGGNLTGSTFFQPELSAKRLELLKEAIPSLTEVGTLLNLANPMNGPVLPQMSEVASSLRVKLHQFDARRPADFEVVVDAMAARVGGFVVNDDAMLIAGAPAIAKLAWDRRLPSIGFPDYAGAGGLIAYGVNFPDLFRRAATFVDKILKGAKPGDLPVERATKFETIVNLKTAKALGIELPTSILLRADKVIE